MKQIIQTLLFASLTVFLALALIMFPEHALKASIRGLDIWWGTVFPSLLPFFITAELLIGFGIVSFLGVLFEPIMRPIFNVPGVGSFAWIMGMASGYPSGAKMSVQLREKEQLTRTEAERLVSFTNASSPLFIFGAVAVGFFNDARLGVLIATSHYVGNALVGVCMRFYGRDDKSTSQKIKKDLPMIIRAFKKMHRERLNDSRPFGEILGNAVVSSVKTLVMIGGFIILFSVFTTLLQLVGITSMLAFLLEYALSVLFIPVELALPLLTGFFEVTMGAQLISESTTNALRAQMILVSFILGFNGFSIQAQVASIIAKTDIRFRPYFFARILHGIFASLLTIVLFKPLYISRQPVIDTIVPTTGGSNQTFASLAIKFLQQTGPIITIVFLAITIILMYKKNYSNNSKLFP
ncbi:sporulation integral membrane protein YlbJ [Virgibacillus sp. W0430]|uniref:sporulation integral membrane protein YlbJ n=1 Tax=Virgibacillus sp. W0430 TaxID=3391580 RepID=UPI003F44F9D3